MEPIAGSMDKHVTDTFIVRMVWIKEMFFRHCFTSLLYSMSLGECRSTRVAWN